MREKKQIPGKMLAIDVVVMLALVLADQFTKYLATTHLKNQPPLVLIDGVLELQYLENRGSAFSLFENQTFFILAIGLVVLAVLFLVMFRLPQKRKFQIAHILLAALAAGALGNIIDRVRLGYVVDFISFVLIHFPVFNGADCCIVVCTIGLFLLFMFVYQEEDLEFLNRKSKR